jgi:hypothetical protein
MKSPASSILTHGPTSPPILARADWGCPAAAAPPRAAPRYTRVTHIIIHHTAMSDPAQEPAAEVRRIWDYHVRTRGWSDIGYNFLIDSDGAIYEGRAGGDGVQGAHFICANRGTLGVALIGDFRVQSPSNDALSSLSRLLAWACARHHLDPLRSSYHAATGLVLPHICGHRDGNPAPPPACPVRTICPGDALYLLLAEIRASARQFLG